MKICLPRKRLLIFSTSSKKSSWLKRRSAFASTACQPLLLSGSTNRLSWLPEPVDVRTKTKIKIPYNPLILKVKFKRRTLRRRPLDALLKAEQYQKLLQQKVVRNNSELAQKEGVSRARITQILNLLRLAPEIKNYLTTVANRNDLKELTERRLRTIASIKDHQQQIERFQQIKQRSGKR